MGDTDLSLVVLAAGVGSRYGGMKQLDTVGPSGETLMEYSVFDAARAGFARVVFVVRPETEEAFRASVGRRIGSHIDLEYVHQTLDALPAGWMVPSERIKPWGTGHAVLAAESVVFGPFAVINADDFYGARSFANLASFLAGVDITGSPSHFALQGFEIGPTLSQAGSVSRGLCKVDGGGWLESIEEVLEVWKDGDGGRYAGPDGTGLHLAGDEPVSMNMWGFTPAIFAELREEFRTFLKGHHHQPKSEFLLPAVVQGLITARKAQVKVLGDSGPWCGMTYPEDRRRAAATIEALIADGVYPPALWGGPDSNSE
jgi:hypothetical protein